MGDIQVRGPTPGQPAPPQWSPYPRGLKPLPEFSRRQGLDLHCLSAEKKQKRIEG